MFCLRLLVDLAFVGWSGLQLACTLLHRPHNAKQVAAINLLDVLSRISLLKQRPGEHSELVVRPKLRGHTSHSIEIRADTHMADAAYLRCMVDPLNHIAHR